MKPTVRKLLVIALGLAAASCATVGKDFDRTHVNSIKAKVHDKAQITAWFGQPARVSTVAGAGGCNEMWLYQYGRSTHGGARTKAAALAVVFDQQGIVCESSYSEQNR
jgi:hypothetical protein